MSDTAGTLTATATDNIPPVITVPDTPVDAGAGTISLAAIAVSDADTVFTQITLSVSVFGLDQLSVTPDAQLQGPASGVELTFIGSSSAIDSDLATLTYQAASAKLAVSTIIVDAANNGTATVDTNKAQQSFSVLNDAADATSWTAIASGQWNTGSTWFSGAAPGAGGAADDFVVGGSNDVTVGDAEAANSLAIIAPGAQVAIDGGTLSLAGAASQIVLVAGTLELDGTLDGNGGTIAMDGGSLDAQFGTFDNVVVQGELVVGGGLVIENGFSIAPASGAGPGTIDVSAAGGAIPRLDFAGNYTLQDTDVLLNGAAPYNAMLTGDTLTLASSTKVTADGALIGGGPFTATSSNLTNDGLVTVTGVAQEQATDFVNDGTIVVDAGSLDVSSGSFDNATSVTVEANGTFFIANGVVFSGAGTVLMESGSTTEVATAVPSGAGFAYFDPATLIIDDPATFGGTIGGLGVGDVIEVKGETIAAGKIVGTTLTLDLVGGGTQSFAAAPGQSGVTFFATPSGGLQVACFAAGTRILTDRGAVPVEELREGDAVASALGSIRRIRWIGHRDIDCARHPRPREVAGERARRRVRPGHAAHGPAAVARSRRAGRWRTGADPASAERRDGGAGSGAGNNLFPRRVAAPRCADRGRAALRELRRHRQPRRVRVPRQRGGSDQLRGITTRT